MNLCVVQQLTVQAERRGFGAIPIIMDDRFQYPSDAFFKELLALSARILSGTGTDRDADDLIALTSPRKLHLSRR